MEWVCWGCRTRVIGNVYDPTREISYSRGNLSFTTINLPMLAIEANHDEKKFYELLDKYLELVKKQLLERFEIQSHLKVKNLPFLMGQGVWLDSEKLGPEDEERFFLVIACLDPSKGRNSWFGGAAPSLRPAKNAKEEQFRRTTSMQQLLPQ